MAGKRIAIVGTGATSAGFGADMVRAGLDVSFIEQWPAHVEAMRADGLRVELPGETVTVPVAAFHLCDVATLRAPFDIVFLGVKGYDTRWACQLIEPLVAPDGLVVGLQNGMTMDAVASIVGPARTLGAVIEVAANMFEPGTVVRQTPPEGTWFAVGAYDEATRGREAEVADVLRHAGEVEIRDDVRSAKWMKLVANAAEFLPSSILGLPLADSVELPGILDVMRAAGREAMRTGIGIGHRLVPIFGDKRVEVNDPDHHATALFDAVLKGGRCRIPRSRPCRTGSRAGGGRSTRSTVWWWNCRPGSAARPRSTAGSSRSRGASSAASSPPTPPTPICCARCSIRVCPVAVLRYARLRRATQDEECGDGLDRPSS